MILTSPRRDAVRVRLVAAGGALAASLLVAAAALALLLGSRRRAVRDIDRAASDLATSSARLILQETANFGLDATNMLLFAAQRDGRVTPISPESLLTRVNWSRRMAIGDWKYTDTLTIAFVGSAGRSSPAWNWAGFANDTLRAEVVAAVRAAVAKSSATELVGLSIPWHGDEMTVWVLIARGDAYHPSVLEGVSYSRTQFITAFVPHVLATVPVLPASVGGTRWDLANPRQALALQQKYVSVRVEDIGSGRTEFDSGVLANEGAHGEYELTSGPDQGIRVRVGLADTLTDALIERVPSSVPEWTLWVLMSIAVGLAVVAVVVTQRAFAGIAQRQRFLAAVSHELRTPLTQVRLAVETMRRLPPDGDERRRRTVDALGRGTEQLTRTVENLLTLAKSELPTWKVRPRATEVESLVRTAVESMTPIAAARQVSFEVVGAGPVYGLVDPDAFRQVILNLLDNALKYGPRDSTVQVRLRHYGDTAELSIADHGPGIPLEQRDRVWDAYERLNSAAASKRDGLGLGLSVVRDIVLRHEGWVRVDENIGGGSVFVVGVPVANASDVVPSTAEYPTVSV
jgi:signal transduction histidine kinase